MYKHNLSLLRIQGNPLLFSEHQKKKKKVFLLGGATLFPTLFSNRKMESATPQTAL